MNVENIFKNNLAFCFLFIANAQIKKEGKYTQIILELKTIERGGKFYKASDFYDDLFSFLEKENLLNYFNYYNNNFHSNLFKKDIFENVKKDYFKYLEVAFETIRKNNIQENEKKLFNYFIVSFFAIRGSFDNEKQYSVRIRKHEEFNIKETSDYYIFLFENLIEITNKINLSEFLRLVYQERQKSMVFWISVSSFNENLNYFLNSKFKNYKNFKKRKRTKISFLREYFTSSYEKFFLQNEKFLINNSIYWTSKNNVNKIEINEKEREIINEYKKTTKRYRDSVAIKQMKEWFYEKNEKNGILKDACSKCKFSFSKERGLYYIEVHHKKPFSENLINNVIYNNIEDVEKDFMFLCPNCHTMEDLNNKNFQDEHFSFLKKNRSK